MCDVPLFVWSGPVVVVVEVGIGTPGRLGSRGSLLLGGGGALNAASEYQLTSHNWRREGIPVAHVCRFAHFAGSFSHGLSEFETRDWGRNISWSNMLARADLDRMDD